MELRRALQENSIVREPLLNARYEQQEVRSAMPVEHEFSCHACNPKLF